MGLKKSSLQKFERGKQFLQGHILSIGGDAISGCYVTESLVFEEQMVLHSTSVNMGVVGSAYFDTFNLKNFEWKY